MHQLGREDVTMITQITLKYFYLTWGLTGLSSQCLPVVCLLWLTHSGYTVQPHIYVLNLVVIVNLKQYFIPVWSHKKYSFLNKHISETIVLLWKLHNIVLTV